MVAGSDSALVEDGAAGAVEEAAEEGVGAVEVGVRSLRRRHHQDISSRGRILSVLATGVGGGGCDGGYFHGQVKQKRRLCVWKRTQR